MLKKRLDRRIGWAMTTFLLTFLFSEPVLVFWPCHARRDEVSCAELLAYSIGVLDVNEVAGYSDFEKILKEDRLAYGESPLPTFFLQGSTKKLNVLYGSCRKIHDDKGGKIDALSNGDALIANYVNDLDRRPAILCLGGDQIYADDVIRPVWQKS